MRQPLMALPMAAALFVASSGGAQAAADCRTVAYYSLRAHQAWTGTFLFDVQPTDGTLTARFFDQHLNDYSATIRIDPAQCSAGLERDLAETSSRAEVTLTRRNHVAMTASALPINKAEYSRLKGQNLSRAVIESGSEHAAALKRKAPDASKIDAGSLGMSGGTLKADVIIDGKSGKVVSLVGVTGIEPISSCQFTDLLRLLSEFRFELGGPGEVRTVLTLDFPAAK